MQLLTKIQILNNCMFGKLKNISVYFLNVTQNYVHVRVPVNWETEKNEKKRKETERKKTKRKQGEK